MTYVNNAKDWKKTSRNLDAPCEKCASFWIEANSVRRLPILQILDFGTPPIPQRAAVEHLGWFHGLSALEFEGVGGVWLCGILSGLSFSDGITGFTFQERVRNEIAHRGRMYRLTLDNMRMAHLWLRDTGVLTSASLRSAAIELGCGFEPPEGAVALEATVMRVTTTYAFRAACRSVVPP